MATRIDFVQDLEVDMAVKILESFDDPSDLIRASAVSHFWRSFVSSNQFSKKLCMRVFPQLSNCKEIKYADLELSNVADREALEREYMCYAFLARSLKTSGTNDCLEEAISASSTDNFPTESIQNTLFPRDECRRRPCYWSSKGSENPEVPETLVYKLLANLCVITEINIKPYQACFQTGDPIYSARAVRFRTGHPRSPSDIEEYLRGLPLQLPADDKFIWTYTSPEFPMDQISCLQKFKLPEPVLCVGGFIQIELLGRIQRQTIDDLYYTCVSHVKVIGEPLFPKFDAEILEPSSGKFLLKYFPENQNLPPPTSRYSQLSETSDNLPDDLRALEQMLFEMLDGNAMDFPWDDEEEDDIDNVLDYDVM